MIPPKKKIDFLTILKSEMDQKDEELNQAIVKTQSAMATRGLSISSVSMTQLNQDAINSLKERAKLIFNELLNFLQKQKIDLDPETTLEALKLLQNEIRSQEKKVMTRLFSTSIFKVKNIETARGEIQKVFEKKASQIIANLPAKFRLATAELTQLSEPSSTSPNLDFTQHIWGDRGFRLFLSHKAGIKQMAIELKESLKFFGVSCFVAHEDISPSEEWQREIETALGEMDGLVALLTKDFHESDWTDQEVGYALARKVPIVPLRLGRDPYGFFGKFQSLPAPRENTEVNWEKTAVEIVKVLINKSDRMFEAYIEKLKECDSWNKGNDLAKIFPEIWHPTTKQIEALVGVYNDNGELQGSYGFNGADKKYYGPGLMEFLNKLGKQQFVMTDNIIEAKI